MGSALVETHELGRDFVQRRRLFQRRSAEHVVALDDVSFAIDAGNCLALVGPNGAGKSTLLRILATSIAPSRGRASVGGVDVGSRPAWARAQVGYAGNSDRSFFWPLTGIENLVFFGQLAGLPASVAEARSALLLEQVGLDRAIDNRVSGYSAGMRQRLGLARALLHDPPVLLLDEPTANLDAEYRDIAIAIINDAVEQGRAVIVATHDPGLVSATATERLRLEDGRVVNARSPAAAVRYVLELATESDTSDGVEKVRVEDLGDGHVLAATISQAIADGRDVVSVEKL